MHMPDHKTSFAPKGVKTGVKPMNMRVRCTNCGDDIVFDEGTPTHCIVIPHETPIEDCLEAHKCGCGKLVVVTFKKDQS